MAYSELIKSFHRVRPYMRSFYVYGFRHRLEHDEKSPRSYDNERRRIESWLGDYLKFSQDTDGRRVFLSVDSRATVENPLYQAFRTKSFTDNDIMLHFLLMDMLDTVNGLCMTDVMDRLEDCLAEFEEIQLPDESSVRKKLKEYESEGIVLKKAEGRQTYYYRANDTVDPDTWTEAISFFSESAPLGVIGSYRNSKNPGFFRFKHHYILNALDSEILYSLCSAMGESRSVILQNRKKSVEMLPLRIYISTQNGRQYVLGKTLQGFQFFRLDSIDDVRAGNTIEVTDDIMTELEEFQSKVWGTAINKRAKTEHVEFVVHAEPEEHFIVQRLEREKRVGTVTELGYGDWKFSADVFDAMELLPWIRTFTGRIISLETDNRQVKKRFYQDLRNMYQIYEGKEDAVF